MHATESFKKLYNSLVPDGRNQKSLSDDHLRQLSTHIIKSFDSETPEPFKQNFKHVIDYLPKNKIGAFIYYTISGLGKNRQAALPYISLNKLAYNHDILEQALKEKDLDYVRSHADIPRTPFPNYLNSIDATWFEKNFDDILKTLGLLNEKNNKTSAQNILQIFLNKDRADLFQIAYPKLHDQAKKWPLLKDALRVKSLETIKILQKDAPFELLAKEDYQTRYGNVQSILNYALSIDGALAVALFEDMKKNNVLDGFKVIPLNLKDYAKDCNFVFFEKIRTSCFKIGDLLPCIQQCIAENNPKLLAFLLQDFSGDLDKIDHSAVRSGIIKNHLECIQLIYQAGYIKTSNAQRFNDTHMMATKTVEMLNFMLTQGHDLPQNKNGMLNPEHTQCYKNYVELLYTYQNLRNGVFKFATNDIETLKSYSLDQLLQPYEIDKNIKAQGLFILAAAKQTDVIIDIALAAKKSGAFKGDEFYEPDPQLELSALGILLNTNEAHHLFDHRIWNGMETALKKIWENHVPPQSKEQYQLQYLNCLQLVQNANHLDKKAPRPLKRRPKK